MVHVLSVQSVFAVSVLAVNWASPPGAQFRPIRPLPEGEFEKAVGMSLADPTFLHFAMRWPSVVAEAIARGASPSQIQNALSVRGPRTAQEYVSVLLLLRAGADPNAPARDRERPWPEAGSPRPIEQAVESGCILYDALLTAAGATAAEEGTTVLHKVADSSSFGEPVDFDRRPRWLIALNTCLILADLERRGAGPAAYDAEGVTPSHIAADRLNDRFFCHLNGEPLRRAASTPKRGTDTRPIETVVLALIRSVEFNRSNPDRAAADVRSFVSIYDRLRSFGPVDFRVEADHDVLHALRVARRDDIADELSRVND